MARRRYYRRSVRTYPKKKWASNLLQGTIGAGTDDSIALVSNSSQSATPTPIIVKAGNFKVQGDVTIVSSTVTSAVVNVFLLYAPEGIGASSTALTSSLSAHPEWVMGWTTVDAPTISSGSSWQGANKFSISTRLKRNLNSGDKIYLFVQYSSGVSVRCDYTAQWFTCAN